MVTYTATDAAGNTTSASFTVTIEDTEAPSIENLPANISTLSNAGTCGAFVQWDAPLATDACGSVDLVADREVGERPIEREVDLGQGDPGAGIGALVHDQREDAAVLRVLVGRIAAATIEDLVDGGEVPEQGEGRDADLARETRRGQRRGPALADDAQGGLCDLEEAELGGLAGSAGHGGVAGDEVSKHILD